MSQKKTKKLTPGERHNLEVAKRLQAEAKKAKANQPLSKPSIEERLDEVDQIATNAFNGVSDLMAKVAKLEAEIAELNQPITEAKK